ncbi:hypothetical protein E1176_19210 [Fulvivirga sp. RKSG066]|uniref:hypothetical protein n=1 Tax=Fulvivirga aurantia TaxID=2529383 RepID=UPI0012BD1412|nr:hypothetical protein [Fulvivirga aurantia]MTI23167.1 hypothetical protein [Fulvivirga aurantia]
MKHSTLLPALMLFFCFTFSNVIGQLRTPSSVGTYEKGTITLESGEEIDGYIYMDMMNPQDFQKRVYFIDEEAYAAYSEGEDVDDRATKYDSKDLQGFSLENGKKFKQARYVNLFAKRKQDKVPKQLLLEVAAEGKVTVFKKYHHTQGFISPYLPDRTKVSDAEYAEWQKNNFEILARKEGEKAVNLSTINIKKLVGDNRAILMNYAKDEYGFRTAFTKGPVFESSFQMDALEALTRMVEDYNKS